MKKLIKNDQHDSYDDVVDADEKKRSLGMLRCLP